MTETLDCSRRRLHGYEYTPLEQSKKDLALAEMARTHPHVNAVMREWVYDYVTEVGEDEMERRIDSGHYYKTESAYAHPTGGLIKAGEVCDEHGVPLPRINSNENE